MVFTFEILGVLSRPIRVVLATHIWAATNLHSLSDPWFEKRCPKQTQGPRLEKPSSEKHLFA